MLGKRPSPGAADKRVTSDSKLMFQKSAAFYETQSSPSVEVNKEKGTQICPLSNEQIQMDSLSQCTAEFVLSHVT